MGTLEESQGVPLKGNAKTSSRKSRSLNKVKGAVGFWFWSLTGSGFRVLRVLW